MTYLSYLFEGAAAGTSATTANTGATTLNKGGGTSTFTAAAAAHGACGLELVTTATAQYNMGRFAAAAPNDVMAFTGVFSYLGSGTGSAPTATAEIGALQNSAFTDHLIRFRVTASNTLAVTDLANVAVGVATPAVTPGTQYRIGVVANRVAGSATVNLYTATGTTPLATWSKASGVSLGSTPFVGTEIGMLNSNQAMTVRWDDLQFNDGATTEIGVYNPAASPLTGSGTLSPTSGPYPLTVTSTLSATGGSNTGRLYSWTWGDGQTTGPQSSGTASHTYSAAGSYQPSGLVTEPA